ncbi:hypothetical protein [Bacillus toyonensis]|nr:hypothetical protein [Bacillus toyonensis]
MAGRIKKSIELYIKGSEHKKLSHLFLDEITATIQNILEENKRILI